MKNFKDFFHKISYLQYPIVLLGMYYALKPIIYEFTNPNFDPTVVLEDFNKVLICFGLSISFSTLQDTTKTQNKLSERVWTDPKKSKVMIIVMALNSFIFIVLGSAGLFFADESLLQDLAIGLLVLGIGMMGMLRSAIEMAFNHQNK